MWTPKKGHSFHHSKPILSKSRFGRIRFKTLLFCKAKASSRYLLTIACWECRALNLEIHSGKEARLGVYIHKYIYIYICNWWGFQLHSLTLHILLHSIPWIPRIYLHVSIYLPTNDMTNPQSLKYPPYAIQHFAKLQKGGVIRQCLISSCATNPTTNPKNSYLNVNSEKNWDPMVIHQVHLHGFRQVAAEADAQECRPQDRGSGWEGKVVVLRWLVHRDSQVVIILY